MSTEKDHPLPRESEATQALALIDAEDYFRAFCKAALEAERSIAIMGWQFDLDTQLLRGDAASRAGHPVAAWELLRSLCDEKPDLQIYVLIWDYSFVYALERQWLIDARATLTGHDRLHVEWRQHRDARGSHHQKLVVIDGRLAFVGGMDLAETRWDRRSHELDDPLRWNSFGLSRPPIHDVQAAVTGPVAGVLAELFERAWRDTTGERPELGPYRDAPAIEDLAALLETPCLELPAGPVGLSRTWLASASRAAFEVRESYESLIAQAQQLIYAETQYFTATAIADALVRRFGDESKPKLAFVILLPDGAESGKERLVLGAQQQKTLARVAEAGRRHGHEVRLLSSGTRPRDGGDVVVTYVHSKLMIVDDRVATIGSANLTNRSMGFDSELNLTFHATDSRDERLAALRCSLLAEHACVDDPERFRNPATLVAEIDRLIAREDSRLRPAPTWEPDESLDELLSAVFDPCVEAEPRGPHEADLRSDAPDSGATPLGGPWKRAVRAVREIL